jgi:hypothetical protein
VPPRESGKGGFGAQPTAVRPGDEQLGGNDGTNAGLVEQRRCECPDVHDDLVFELLGFECRGLDPAGETAQHETSGELVGGRVRAAQAAAALEQPPDGQPAQLLAELVGGGHDHAAQLHERFAVDVDCAPSGDEQEPQRFADERGFVDRAGPPVHRST